MKFFAIIFVTLSSVFQVKMERVSLPGNKASLLAPTELTKMSDELWKLKYQNRVRPALVLTDKNGEVNLIGDITQQKVPEEQLAAFTDFQVAQLKKGKKDLKVLQQGVKLVNGKKVGYFKFLTQAIDQKVFNYYFYTVVDGNIIFFTFNCIQKVQQTWEKTADEVMASLKTK